MLLSVYLKSKIKIDKEFNLYGFRFRFYREKSNFKLKIIGDIPEIYKYSVNVIIPKQLYTCIDIDKLDQNYDENQFIHNKVVKLLIMLPPKVRELNFNKNAVPKTDCIIL